MTTDTKYLQRYLLTTYSDYFKEIHFYKLKDQFFGRKIENGVVAFHAQIRCRADQLAISGDVCIRFDEVERIRNRFTGMSVSVISDTWTVACRLGSLTGEPLKHWNVTTVEDVRTVVLDVLSDFTRVGLPYLDKYSSRHALLRDLSADDRRSRELFHIPESKRLMNVIVLAKLCGDIQKFDKFVDRFQRYAEMNAPNHRVRVRQLAFIRAVKG